MITKELAAQAQAIYENHQRSFLLFDFDGIKSAVARFQAAWNSCFPQLKVAYSYKTNSLRAVCQFMGSLGLSAEVVSGAEFKFALSDGFAGEDVLFDGPLKTVEELNLALTHGASIQIDSLDELRDAIGIIEERRLAKPRLSLRLAAPYKGGWSRFGLTKEEFYVALELLGDHAIALSGIHLHVGSNLESANQHIEALEYYRDELKLLIANAQTLPSIDIGGGYPARSHRANGPVPRIEDFARTIAAAMERLGFDDKAFQLVVEPGRCLVEDFGYLVSPVQVRKTRGDKGVLVVEAGIHLVRSLNSWRHGVAFLRQSEESQAYDVYGSNCFESDLFKKDLVGPKDIKRGDLIIVNEVGGYDIPSANVWTRESPAVFSVFEGKIGLVRERQDWESMRDRQGSFMGAAHV